MAQIRVSVRRICSLTRLKGAGPSRQSLLPPCSSSSVRLHSSASIQSTPSSKPKSKSTCTRTSTSLASGLGQKWDEYSRFPQASNPSDFNEGGKVTVHGFLARRRVLHSRLVFADIEVSNGPVIQITSQVDESGILGHGSHAALRAIPLHSPVSVTGIISKLSPQPDADNNAVGGAVSAGLFPQGVSRIDMNLDSIQPLNEFPGKIIVSKEAQFPPSSRHLQIRFSEELRSRLAVRHRMSLEVRKTLDNLGFTEVETPLLFKSTPEGAREFLVPTRRPNLAYALPQSPQQYKQILMASGIHRYYQVARCFRDEDLRADRQPEFTQLDLEMSFATGENVMRTVESLIVELLAGLDNHFYLVKTRDSAYPAPKSGITRKNGESLGRSPSWQVPNMPFQRLSYQEAMSRFGSDKPDLRIPYEIRRVDHVLPSTFKSMISDLEDPIVEAFRFRPSPCESDSSEGIPSFVHDLMEGMPAPLARNGDGAPVALIFDSMKPMSGLSSLGYKGLEGITGGQEGLEDFQNLEDGDVLIFQARQNQPFSGGSTAIGTLRNLVYHQAVSKGLLPRSFDFKFLWVNDFPMFTLNNETDPGQGGQAGFSATHHPFTAPLTEEDAQLLARDPLKAKADHYDLVVNGVELGGGSRRIHVADMQEYVMREVLKMTDKGIAQFSHLLEALRAGCPPHAGFAIGFDRLVAVLTYTDSVRDVIAFPKSMKGEDLCVKSPGKITQEELATYHLAFAVKGG